MVLGLAVVATCWIAAWTRTVVPAFLDRRAFLAAQAEAATFPTTADRVLLRSDADPAPLPSLALHHKYNNLLRRTRQAYSPGLVGQPVFLRERTSKDGERRLVAIYAAFTSSEGPAGHELKLFTWSFPLRDDRWLWSPSTARRSAQQVTFSSLNLSIKPGEVAVLFGGAADPVDASHIVLPFTIDGAATPIHLHLVDPAPSGGRADAGVRFDEGSIPRDRPWGMSASFHPKPPALRP
jgi:hypothetical protein